MLAPTLSLIAMPREQPRPRAARAAPRALRWSAWIAAAPFLCAAMWATATGAALTVWAVTGDPAPLDWLRSGHGLITAAAVTAAALLAASLLQALPAPSRRPARRRPAAPDPDGAAASGWQLEEGRFELV